MNRSDYSDTEWLHILKYGDLDCPVCKHKYKYYKQSKRLIRKGRQPTALLCNSCGTTFSPRSDTIFYATRLPLSKWTEVNECLKNGVLSRVTIGREVGISRLSACRIVRLIQGLKPEDPEYKFLNDTK